MEEKKLQENVEKIKKEVQAIVASNEIENIIINNQIMFEYNKTKYRVNAPNYIDKQKANQHRVTRYMELLKNPAYLLEKDLIDVYKTRGIDITEMTNSFNQLEKQKESYFMKLGEAVKDSKPENELELYRDELKKLIDQQQEILVKKAALMESSIESQVEVAYYLCLSSLIIDKMINEDLEKPENSLWKKAWESCEDFLKEPETLVNICVFYTSLLVKDELVAGK